MKIHHFENKEAWLKLRLSVITSTEVSALFNLNPYITLFELAHQKKDQQIVMLEDNERMFWGETLEPAIAEGVAKKNGWTAAPFKTFCTDDEIRAGSSFDFVVDTPEGQGILEIKNVDWLQIRDKWEFENGVITEAPAHIEMQVQHQLMITGMPFAYIAALEGGNKIHLLKRTPQPGIIKAIRTKINKFWHDLDAGAMPEPDFQKDAAFIAELYGFAEPGKVMDVPSERIDQLAIEYREASEIIKDATKRKDAAKAELLTLIGESEKVLGGDYTISAGMVAGGEVSYVREPYRNFRINFKKEKKK